MDYSSIQPSQWQPPATAPEGKLFTGLVEDRFGEYALKSIKRVNGALIRVNKGKETPVADGIVLRGWKDYHP